MVLLNIFNLDDIENQNIIASLRNGTHVIGRGDLLHVRDKRVSRQHAVINVSDESITLTSAHVNPCFFQSSESRNLSIVNKDNTNELEDGDKFGLLPESLWFRVKIDREAENDEGIDNDQQIDDALDVTAEPDNLDITTDHVKENEAENDEGLNSRDESNGLKRHITEDVHGNCNDTIKKARLTIDEASTSSSNITNNHKESENSKSNLEKNQNMTSPLSQAESLNLQLDEEDDVFSEEHNQKEKIDSSNNASTSSKVDNNEASRTEASHLDEELYTSVNLNETADVADTSMENDMTTAADNVNTDVRIEVDEIKQEDISIPNSQQSSTSQNVTVKQEIDATGEVKTEPDDGTGQSGGDNIASGSGGAKKTRRERCWYAERCFRKNPHHRETFSHPGDQDYDSDPEDDRPDCPFGTACYRKNIEHRQEYKHANRPAPRPSNNPVKVQVNLQKGCPYCSHCNRRNSGGCGDKYGYESDPYDDDFDEAPVTSPPKNKRQTKQKTDDDNNSEDETDDDSAQDDDEPSQDTQEMKKRRREKAARKAKLNETPEDDYDYDDPFLCDDSSDEFQCDDDDDTDDSEWDDSQVVEEDKKEQKRLLKEVKKFRKAKNLTPPHIGLDFKSGRT